MSQFHISCRWLYVLVPSFHFASDTVPYFDKINNPTMKRAECSQSASKVPGVAADSQQNPIPRLFIPEDEPTKSRSIFSRTIPNLRPTMISSVFRRKGSRKERNSPLTSSSTPGEYGLAQSETSTTSTDVKVDTLNSQIEALREQLAARQAQNEMQNQRIESLESQIEMLRRKEGLEERLASYLLHRAEELLARSQEQDDTKGTRIDPLKQLVEILSRNDRLEEELTKFLKCQTEGCFSKQDISNPTKKEVEDTIVQDASNQVERWLLTEGSHLPDIELLISRFAELCLSLGIPIDRLVIFSTGSYPKSSSNVWKWEFSKHFRAKEVGSDLHYRPDEPVRILMEGKAMEYRMRAGVENGIIGCRWFTTNNFQDYFALPIYHRGKFMGSIAWSTKSTRGFNDSHIELFRNSLIAFCPILQCQLNDAIIRTFKNRLEDEIMEQTAELATANKSLAMANEKIVQQAESQLRNFAMMSHEIRTPLNCIVGLSNLLLSSDDLDPTLQESIEMITSSGDLLLAVVDDVLDYSKLAAGKVETKIESIQTQQVVRAVVTSVDIRAKSTGVDLRTNLAANLPLEVETDGRRLQQILYNLLGNAIKFGREGRVVDFSVDVIGRDQTIAKSEAGVEVHRPSPDDIIRFTVKDYGKGIHPSEIHKIFQPFQQAATNDPSHGGTGLGLAITRQLVRVLGGTISVESDYGSWCKFTILLPQNPERPIVTSCNDEQKANVEEPTAFPTASQRSIQGGCGSSFEDDDFSSSDDESFSSSTSFSTTSNHAPKISSSHARHISLPKVPSLFPCEGIDLFPNRPDKSLERILRSSSGGDVPGSETLLTLDEVKNLLSCSRDVKNDRCPRDNDCFRRESPAGTSSRQDEAAEAVPATKNPIEFDKLKVLIAEDNQINQKVLYRTLTRIGLKDIDIVSDGKQAVEAQESKGYDVIFMDLQMPVMDGLEATGIISSRRRQKNETFPKIAFLTAHALQDYQDKAADSGGDGFISKPFKLEMLRELITRFMQG